MAQSTQRYSRSLSGSIGAGVSSVIGGNDRRYYVLEHQVSSKYHKAGENQKIIVDQIELGRDPKCQVRFDENFGTVSRRHAAIVKDGDNWKLVQLSNTNSTYLNGYKVDKEWYLQNGDVIQLSTNGPKMKFVIPDGEKGLVKSIGFSQRLSLFRKQALRPYKHALTALACLLVMGLGVSTYIIWKQHVRIVSIEEAYTRVDESLERTRTENSDLYNIIDGMRQRADSIDNAPPTPVPPQHPVPSPQPAPDIPSLIAAVKPSVYYIETIVHISDGNRQETLDTSCGTGFMLEDGRFVTARHCVESWLYDDPCRANIINETYDNVRVWSEIKAYGANGDNFTLRSSDFNIDRSKDCILDVGHDENGRPLKMRLAYLMEQRNPQTGEIIRYGTPDMWGTDWAVAQTNKTGRIKPNGQLSTSLTAGQEVHVLGFPVRLGVEDGQNRIEPIYNKMSVARDGINNSGCIMVSQGTNHGNSGGPVFVLSGNELYAVAIVSRLETNTQMTNESGNVIQQAQQYDHLVPINSIR